MGEKGNISESDKKARETAESALRIAKTLQDMLIELKEILKPKN